MDLSNLTLAELKTLLNDLPIEIKKREKEEKAKVLKELETLAEGRGFKLEDIVGALPEKKGREPIAVKFRHPDNPGFVWSGRGRKPKWVIEFLSKNGSMEQLAV